MGMILFSITSGKIPFGRDEDITDKILKGEKPGFEAYWHTGYMEVRGGCWPFYPLGPWIYDDRIRQRDASTFCCPMTRCAHYCSKVA